MADCVFCKIARGEIPADIVWQDEHTVAFRDVHPQAPVHVLLIPRSHVESFGHLRDSDAPFLSSLARGIREVAIAEGVDGTGYRLLSNNGPNGGQEVLHLHVHLLGGRGMGPMVLDPTCDR
jgi:histidine triad (HIT) family protein